MIVFDPNVCPTLILAAIPGEMLQYTMRVHICVHSRRLYILFVKYFLYADVFQDTLGACFNINEASRMAVYLSNRPQVFMIYRLINDAECWYNTRRIRKSNSSSVLPTSQVVYQPKT